VVEGELIDRLLEYGWSTAGVRLEYGWSTAKVPARFPARWQPPVGAKTGHPVGDQPVEVKPVAASSAADVGFTGSKGDKITAALSPATAVTIIASFTSYYVKKDIPTSINVPCSGTGTMVFVPSPTSKTAKTAKLTVTFGNIAG
jgi:hypothetical protein